MFDPEDQVSEQNAKDEKDWLVCRQTALKYTIGFSQGPVWTENETH